MDIEPIRPPLIAVAAADAHAPAMPSPQAVDAFTQALFNANDSVPEDAMMLGIQKTAYNTGAALREARELSSTDGPLEMMKTQSKLLQTVLQMDLTAKIAGTATQCINKLTNMQ